MEELEQNQTLLSRLKSFILESRRVFRITKRPSKDEFKAIVKISSIGIALIGIIGFIIQIIWRLAS
ncbi:protein translocase SEC61 complex subunit gamma [Candidatus Woesearchaeota archaeon]|nr:protein translocase SEC61 complex subunit gamma [Candidatus Woesearchaeota archaeon]